MRALTLWQPWATLVIEGVKVYETRSRKTHIRGEVAMHSAKTKKGLSLPVYQSYPDFAFPLGCVLGVVDIISCIPTEDFRPEECQRLLGDFSPGRYVWEVKVIEKFKRPVLVKGGQGFWRWDEVHS